MLGLHISAASTQSYLLLHGIQLSIRRHAAHAQLRVDVLLRGAACSGERVEGAGFQLGFHKCVQPTVLGQAC